MIEKMYKVEPGYPRSRRTTLRSSRSLSLSSSDERIHMSDVADNVMENVRNSTMFLAMNNNDDYTKLNKH